MNIVKIICKYKYIQDFASFNKKEKKALFEDFLNYLLNKFGNVNN